MKKGFMIIALMVGFALMGCNGNNATIDQGSEPVTEKEGEVAKLEDTVASKYKVELGEGKKVESSYDGECLEVTYAFTNESDEAVAADTALMFIAYQDGVQIDSAFDSELTGDNESKSIKPGTTLECKRLFKLTSASDVEVEVKEFLGMDGSKTIKTYELQ